MRKSLNIKLLEVSSNIGNHPTNGFIHIKEILKYKSRPSSNNRIASYLFGSSGLAYWALNVSQRKKKKVLLSAIKNSI